MKWSIRREFDGIITDDPKKYLDVCKQYKGDKVHVPLGAWAVVICLNFFAGVFSLVFRCIYGSKVDVGKVRKSLMVSGARTPE